MGSIVLAAAVYLSYLWFEAILKRRGARESSGTDRRNVLSTPDRSGPSADTGGGGGDPDVHVR